MLPRPILIHAEGLGYAYPCAPVFAGLAFAVGPGLSLIRGGDGRGKSTLLRLLAGRCAGYQGRLLRDATLQSAASSVFLADPRELTALSQTALNWLAQQAQCFPSWDAQVLGEVLTEFRMEEHLGKTLPMLSTGVLRKLWLSAAMASGARLTLLETPWAGLDAPSRASLDRRLHDAARDTRRAWVVADHDFEFSLVAAACCHVDLGD